MEVIKEFNITILAEEFNDEAKKIWGVSETTLEKFGKAKGIKHRFCEPGREEVWLSQIEDCKEENMLFVCGDDHFESFGKTLLPRVSMLSMGRDGISVDDEFFFSDP